MIKAIINKLKPKKMSNSINKKEAQEQMIALKSQMDKLEKIINAPENIKDRIKTFKDAYEHLGIATIGDAYRVLEMVIPEYISHNAHIRHSDARLKLLIIVFALNEGWFPDWSNKNEYKYYPYFEYNNGRFCYSDCFSYSGCSCAALESGLYLKSSDLSLYIGNQFINEYNEYLKK